MANTYTVETVLQRVKLAVNDVGTGGDGDPANIFLTDAQYNTFIGRACVAGTSGSFKFTLVNTGLWRADDTFEGNPYVFEPASTTAPFTGAGTNATYYLSCWGTITCAQTDTTASYSITGARYDFAAIMYELYFWLAAHRTLQIAERNGVTPGETYRYLTDVAEKWQGIRS